MKLNGDNDIDVASRSRWLINPVLIGFGWLCVVLGVLGVFLPLLPTTPFLLLAAWAFTRSSPRFRHWLYEHNILGPYISDWTHYGVVPLSAKIVACVTMSASMIWLAGFSGLTTWILVVVGLCLACVAGFLLSRPSAPPDEA